MARASIFRYIKPVTELYEAKVSVAIVNYRTPSLCIASLASLEPELAQLKNAHVYVVDNHSRDNSVREIQHAIEARRWSWATCLPLDINGGYSAGNNIAIRRALDESSDYVLLLNPDTEVRSGAVVHLLRFLETHPEAGIAGSRLEDADGTVQRSAFRFPSALGELDEALRFGLATRALSRWTIAPAPSATAESVDWVAGASMMVRREVFDVIGLLDPEYFLYFEEVDFCRRARQAGWSSWYVPESRVVHYVGQSTGVTNAADQTRRRPGYWFESRRRYFLKHHGLAYAAAVDAVALGATGLWRVRRQIQRKPRDEPQHFVRDLVSHSPLLNPRAWSTRKRGVAP